MLNILKYIFAYPAVLLKVLLGIGFTSLILYGSAKTIYFKKYLADKKHRDKIMKEALIEKDFQEDKPCQYSITKTCD